MTEPLQPNLATVAADMADTLRAVLMVVDKPVTGPYPWEGGALKNQIREDLTAYDLLGLDAVPFQGEEPRDA